MRTNQPTTWSGVLENLPVTQLVKEFPTFMELESHNLYA